MNFISAITNNEAGWKTVKFASGDAGASRRDACATQLLQRRRLPLVAFQFEHHAADVLVVLVRLQELQTLLRIAPLQDLNGLLPCAPRIHVALIRHVKIDRIATGQGPAVIIDTIDLPG